MSRRPKHEMALIAWMVLHRNERFTLREVAADTGASASQLRAILEELRMNHWDIDLEQSSGVNVYVFHRTAVEAYLDYKSKKSQA